MTLRPTLASIEDLFHKAEREAYRAFHHPNRTHKADHFFNFCVTAHALQDYFFERQGVPKNGRQPYYDQWNNNPVLVAVGEIANTSKHFVLRYSGGAPKVQRTKRVRTTRNVVVDIFVTTKGEILSVPVRRPDVSVTPADDKPRQLYQFTEEVLKHWRTFLGTHGIRIRRQSFRQLAG